MGAVHIAVLSIPAKKKLGIKLMINVSFYSKKDFKGIKKLETNT